MLLLDDVHRQILHIAHFKHCRLGLVGTRTLRYPPNRMHYGSHAYFRVSSVPHRLIDALAMTMHEYRFHIRVRVKQPHLESVKPSSAFAHLLQHRCGRALHRQCKSAAGGGNARLCGVVTMVPAAVAQTRHTSTHGCQSPGVRAAAAPRMGHAAASRRALSISSVRQWTARPHLTTKACVAHVYNSRCNPVCVSPG